jgi:two-component system, cell cycle sensor histidine kinase and response regulator CckA
MVSLREKAASGEPLSEAQRMETMGRLLSAVAHDFNNLLTGIVLSSDLLLAGLEKDSPLRRYVLEIRTAGGHSAAMIHQLLALARQQPSQPALFPLNEVISAMRPLLRRLIGENIELVMELAANPSLVKMDPAQLEQIVLNLALNARDALPAGGTITIYTRNCQERDGRTIELEVDDTGIGMDAATRERIFEPFYTTKPAGKGTGLGLSTVCQILQQYGGKIHVESESGKGTRVMVHLPDFAAGMKNKISCRK